MAGKPAAAAGAVDVGAGEQSGRSTFSEGGGAAAPANYSTAPARAAAPPTSPTAGAATVAASEAVYPMEVVCMKRTIVRRGYEMASPQCGQLESGQRVTALEGLEGRLGHSSILRVRLGYPNDGWVTMTGVDGQQICPLRAGAAPL